MGLQLEDVLLLLLYMYSALDVRWVMSLSSCSLSVVRDHFDPEEEDRLRAVLADAFLRWRRL